MQFWNNAGAEHDQPMYCQELYCFSVYQCECFTRTISKLLISFCTSRKYLGGQSIRFFVRWPARIQEITRRHARCESLARSAGVLSAVWISICFYCEIINRSHCECQAWGSSLHLKVALSHTEVFYPTLQFSLPRKIQHIQRFYV